MDGEGMRPDLLDEKLSSWNDSEGRKPRVAYIVPYVLAIFSDNRTGQNPTGASMFLERRKQLYSIFQKHDIIIIEDEPYCILLQYRTYVDFLQMEPYTGQDNPTYTTPTNSQQLISSLIPSFLHLDVDGRVIRLDSLSKILAPGIRLGFITASSQLIERLLRIIEVTSQAPSGFSQSIAHQLLSQHWGHEGFFQWLIYMRSEYTKRRDICCRAIDKYLPKQVMEYTVPAAGMFFWIHVTKSVDGMNSTQLGEKIFQKCLEYKVLVVPGDVFKANLEEKDEQVYFRGTFAAVPFDKLEIGIQRLGKVLEDVFNL
jgi:aromatic amino acid aminotransferase I / 2-aminoadipate transaminase